MEENAGATADEAIDEKVKEILFTSLPADFSFRKYKNLQDVGIEGVRSTRVLATPSKGKNEKYLTKAIWFNNNKIKNIKNLDVLVNLLLEYPLQLSWIDFSFNYIKTIDESILKFPHLKIVYFHGNCISELDEIFKLRPLKELRTVTFQGNPISNHPKYRNYVISALPQVLNLDYTPILKTDKMMPLLPEVIKKIEASKKIKKH